jgi:hypothetical protein
MPPIEGQVICGGAAEVDLAGLMMTGKEVDP